MQKPKSYQLMLKKLNPTSDNFLVSYIAGNISFQEPSRLCQASFILPAAVPNWKRDWRFACALWAGGGTLASPL